MKLAFLKKIRVVVSLTFFALIFFAFIDFRNVLPEKFINGLLYLQFGPSLMKFISILSVSALGFFIIAILTLLFGRIYCSSICPLGTLQDAIGFVSRKIKRRKKKKRKIHQYRKPHNWLRYSFLIVTAAVLIFSGAFMLNLLDPFSNFGRIAVNLFKPGYIACNNAIAYLLLESNIFWLYPAKYAVSGLGSLVYPVAILALIAWLSYAKGRLYCNTVCPVGTFLGLLSRFSLFKISIDSSKCNHCGLCEWDCKAQCIDKIARSIDHSRCIGCFNCFTACNRDAVNYKFAFIQPKRRESLIEESNPDLSKRDFIAGTIAMALASFGFRMKNPRIIKSPSSINANKDIVITKASTVPEKKEFPVAPPGAGSIRKFNNTCTACHLCVSACPNHALQPALTQYGLIGFMQPHMEYHSGFCNFDCTLCMDICPSGALLPMALEDKQLEQVGKVVFIKENCVVETEGSDCGACSEHCPTKAVDMVPYKNDTFIPEVDETICIGCGACEHACPTTPYKAIYVNGNALHVKAEKPKQEKLDTEIDYEDDFPF